MKNEKSPNPVSRLSLLASVAAGLAATCILLGGAASLAAGPPSITKIKLADYSVWTNVIPGAVQLQGAGPVTTNLLEFSVGASPATNAYTNVTVTLIGTNLQGLVTSNTFTTNNGTNNGLIGLSGVPGQAMTMKLSLSNDTMYSAVITAICPGGTTTSNVAYFDTISPYYYTWEAEDWDYTNTTTHLDAQFFDNPQVDLYTNLSGVSGIDFGEITPVGGQGASYRPSAAGAGLGTEVNGDLVREQYVSSGESDFDVGWNNTTNSWGNYTRTYPSGLYNIYARISGNAATANALTLSLVTSGRGTTSQVTNKFGTFSTLGLGWQVYTYVPCLDTNNGGQPAAWAIPANTAITTGGATEGLSASGDVETVSFSVLNGNCNENYYMLVPAVTALTPTNTAVYAGSISTVSVDVMALPSVTTTFQWQTNGSGTWGSVTGATSSSYVVPTATLGTMQYRLQVTVNGGTVSYSQPVSLTVNNAASKPVIVQDTTPLTTSVSQYRVASFTASFTGTTPITNQWFVSTNGGTTYNLLPNQTNTTLQLSEPLVGTFKYRLVASNSVGSTTSTAATLTVTPTTFTVVNFDSAGAETSNPGPTNIWGGSNAATNFSGQAAYHDVATNIYWNPIVVNGTTPAAGATNSDGVTVSTITLTQSQNGTYANGGSARPPTNPPPNGTFPSGTGSSTSTFVTVADVGLGYVIQQLSYAFASEGASAHSTNTLNNVPAGIYNLYQYVQGDNGPDGARGSIMYVTSGGVNYGTNYAVNAPFQTNWILGVNYLLFSNIVVPAGGGTISFVYYANPITAPNGQYTGANAEADWCGLQLVNLSPGPPVIAQQPPSETILVGGSASFTVGAIANPSGALTYQWLTNGVPVTDGTHLGSIFSGSTNSTLTVAPVALADPVNYSVIVTGTNGGATTSATATLTVLPLSGEPEEATVMAYHPLHFYEFNEITNVTSGTAVAYDYVGGANGIYGTNTQNGFNGVAGPSSPGYPGFSSTNVAAGYGGYGTIGGLNVNISTPWNLNTNVVTITAWVNPNNGPEATNQRIVFSRGGGTVAGLGFSPTLDANGQTTLSYTWNNDANTYNWNSGLEVPANYWSFVSLAVTSSNATLSVMSLNLNQVNGLPGVPGLASATHVYPHVVQSFSGTTWVGDDPADTNAVNVFPGAIDNVAVFNQALSFSQLTNIFDIASGQVNYAPFITGQPLPVTTYPGLSAQFTPSVIGTGTLSYQWYGDSGGNYNFVPLANGPTGTGSTIYGSQGSILTISNTGSSDNNNYEVVVTGYGGSANAATSVPALLTVLLQGSPINITMSVQQAIGTDWNAPNWSTGAGALVSLAENPGSTFEILSGALMRTVTNGLNVAFPGAQLTIDGANAAGLLGDVILNHAAANTTFTITNLVMDGGRIDNGNDGLVTIAGAMNVKSNSAIVGDAVITAVNFDVAGSVGVNFAGQGAFSDPGRNYWNPVVNNGTTRPATNDDGVTVSTVTLTAASQSTGGGGTVTQGTPSGLENRFDTIGGNGTENNTLNNVPAGTYSLYLYGVNGGVGHDRGTTFWVSTDVATTPVTNSTFNTLGGTGSFVQGNDYVVFSNLVVGAGGTIHFSYTANTNADNGNIGGNEQTPPNTEGDFNGLQLVTFTNLAVRPIAISAALSGWGTLQFTGPDMVFASDLNITGAANTFTGQWNVTQGALLGSGANSLGTNSITVGGNGALETLYNVNDPNATLSLYGKMFLHQSDVFKNVLVNGAYLAPGFYSAATLAGTYPATFPTSWTQQIGSSASTSSGGITVNSAPAPQFPQQPTPSTLSIYQHQMAQFSATALGAGMITNVWQINSNNLTDGTNTFIGATIFGSTTVSNGTATTSLTLSNVLSSATLGSSTNYYVDLVTSSAYGSSTSLVAVLTVIKTLPPQSITTEIFEAAGYDWDSATNSVGYPNWSDQIGASVSAIEAPGSTYHVAHGTMERTPISSNAVFPGFRIVVEGDGVLVDGNLSTFANETTTGELRLKQSGTNIATNGLTVYTDGGTVSFPDLQLNGGQIDNGTGSKVTLLGQLDVLSSSTIYIDSGAGTSIRPIQISSLLTGSGTLSFTCLGTAFASNDLIISGTANTFTGQWIVSRGALLGAGAGSLGTNSITVGTNGALETLYNINDPNATLTISANGQVYLHQNDVFKSVQIGNGFLAPNTYADTALATAYPAVFPATWPEQIGSSVSNRSGSIQVLYGPPPMFTAQITPLGLTNYQSQTAQFSASAIGTGPVTYNWQFNNTNISDGTNGSIGVITGSTNTSLTISNIMAAPGIYNVDVVAVSSYGNTTSAVAVLTVLSGLPQIVAQIAPAGPTTNYVTVSTVFSASFSSPGSIGYQWQQSPNGTTGWASITNGTNTSLTVQPLLPGATWYRLQASNALGSNYTLTSELTALPPPPLPAFPVATAGDLIVNLRAVDLIPGITVWSNRTSNPNSVGDFTNFLGTNLNVTATNALVYDYYYVTPLFVNGVVANAVQSALNTPSEINGNGPVTMEVWTYATGVNGNDTVLSYGNESGGSTTPLEQRALQYGNAAAYGGFTGYFDGADMGWLTAPTTGVWHYLAAVYDGATVTIYQDGLSNGTNVNGGGYTATANLITLQTFMEVGSAIGATGVNGSIQPFLGYVGAARVQSGVLTPAQILNNYNAGLFGAISPLVAVPPTPVLVTSISGGQITLTWSIGVLLQAPTVNGPWTAVTPAPAQPFVITPGPGAPAAFYRVVNP